MNVRPIFLHYVAELENFQGSRPVAPWYVDTVALIHKERAEDLCVCVSERDGDRET